MSCGERRSALLDVALGGEAEAELEAHLAGCEECRAGLRAERALVARIDGEVQGMLGAEPAAGLVARARQRLPAPRRAAGRALLPAAAVAAGLLLWWRWPAAVAPPAAPPSPEVASTARPPVVPPPPASVVAATVGLPRRPPSRRPARAEPAMPEVLVAVEEREALQSYLVALTRQGTRQAWPRAAATALRPPSADLAPLPSQAAVTAIDLLPAPRGIEMGAIPIAPIGVQLLKTDLESED